MGGLGLLVVLINFMGYPNSMLTVPGETFSNSRPPSLALLALGVFHTGLLLAIEAPARRWLQRRVPWTLTVLVNARIMTLYLWHLTVMVLLVALALQFGDFGLDILPESSGWWPVRLLWLGILFAILLVLRAIRRHSRQPVTELSAAEQARLDSILQEPVKKKDQA